MRRALLAAGLLTGTTLTAEAQAPQPPVVAPYSPENAVTAPIAYMLDLGSDRVLLQREADRRFMPASLTKIMTAYVAFEMIAAGKLRPGQRVVFGDEAFAKWHRVGSTMFLARGQQVSVDELLMGIMTVSANDGCVALAEGVSGSVPAFVALMNLEARKLGMRDSRFGSPNGWPDQGATFTTARDLATLTKAMIVRHPALYRRYVGHTEMTFNGIRQGNHVPLLGRTPGADGVKTGFTNEAGYGLVGSAVRNGRRLVMVVGGYDRPYQRANESRALLEWGYSAWRTRPLFARGERVALAQVQGGAVRRVPLVAPLPLYLTLGPGETTKGTELTVAYSGPVVAPIRKGTAIGELRIAVPGQPLERLPLFAGDDVAAANPAQRLRNGLLGLVGA